MSMSHLLYSQDDNLTTYDLAILADWAATKAHEVPNKDWKRAYALIREGADLLLRRYARSMPNAVERPDDGTADPCIDPSTRNIGGPAEAGIEPTQ